jgi:hypothetical protein
VLTLGLWASGWAQSLATPDPALIINIDGLQAEPVHFTSAAAPPTPFQLHTDPDRHARRLDAFERLRGNGAETPGTGAPLTVVAYPNAFHAFNFPRDRPVEYFAHHSEIGCTVPTA